LATLTAQQYRQEIGWNVIPIQQGTKNPKGKWKPFQDRLMTREEFQSQFSPTDGVAAICGQTSGNLAVLDFDHADAYQRWRAQNEELASRLPIATTSRGFHVFLRTPAPERKRMLSVPGFAGHAGELIGEGGYIVLPPTRHPSGASREWLQPPTADIPVVPIAELGVTFMSSQSPTQSPVQSPAVAPPFGGAPVGAVTQGGRHQTLLKYAASLRARGLQSHEIGQLVHAENLTFCQPPLDAQEVDSIIQWAGNQLVGMHHHPLYTRSGMTSGGKAVSPTVIDSVSLRDDEDIPLDELFKPLPTYLAELPADSYEWIIEGFMARGSLTIVGGNSKAGKTVLATNVAMAVATGTPFLGMPTTTNAVLWLAYEESEAERGAVLKMYDSQPDNLYVTHEKLYLDSPEAMEKIRYWIRKTGAGLVIIDPLYGACQADSLGDGRTARATLTPLKEICRTENVTAWVLHHLTKQHQSGMVRERMADSNQILATASSDFLVDCEEDSDGGRTLTLHGRGRGAFANQVWKIRSTSETDFTLLSMGKAKESARDAILELIESEGECTAEQIAERLQMNSGTVKNRLTDLRKKKLVLAVGRTGSNALTYRVGNTSNAGTFTPLN